jgi:hypothetical protein
MSRKIRVSNNNKKNTRRLRGGVVELKPEDSEEFSRIQTAYFNSGVSLKEAGSPIQLQKISNIPGNKGTNVENYVKFIGEIIKLYEVVISKLAENTSVVYDDILKELKKQTLYKIPEIGGGKDNLPYYIGLNDTLKLHLENQKNLYTFLSSKQKAEKAAAVVNPVIAVIDEVIQTLPDNNDLKIRLGEYRKFLQEKNILSDIDAYNTKINEDGSIEECFRKQLVKQIETYRDEYGEDDKANFKIILEDYKEKEDKYIKSNQKLFSFEIILRNEPMVEVDLVKQLISYREVYSTGADLINGDVNDTENRYQNINLYENFIQRLRAIILNNSTINKELANAAEIILKDFETRSAKLLRSKMDVKDRFTKKIRYTTNATSVISKLIPKTQSVDNTALKESLLTDDSTQIAVQAATVKAKIDELIGPKSNELKGLEEKYKSSKTDLTEKVGIQEQINVRKEEIKDLKKDRSNIEKIEKMKRISLANTNNLTVKNLMPSNIFGKPKPETDAKTYIEPKIVDGDNGDLTDEGLYEKRQIKDVARIHIEISKGGLKVITKDERDTTLKEYPITDAAGWNNVRSDLFGFGPVDENIFIIPKYENGIIKFIMYLGRRKMTVQINNSEAKVINSANALKLFAPELDKVLNARPAKSFFSR